MSLQRDIDWYDEEERDVDFVQHLVEELLAERERLRSVLHAFKSASDTTHSERRPGMSSFEELRDQWIHDHVPSATLSLHYVFEAAENRIAALEAELEDSVHRGWDGLLTILTDIYPASIFGGVDDDWQDETRDLGPRLVTLARHLDAERKRAEHAEAEVERLKILNGNLRSELEDARRGS